MPRAKNSGKLLEQQKLFCREYLVDRNATAAAIRAGYSKQSANTNSCRMMKSTKIKLHIGLLDRKIKSDQLLSATETLERISEEAVNMDAAPRDRLRALELLAKHWGLLVERHEVGGPGEFVKLSDAEIDREIMALGALREAAKPLVN